jgi:predicted lipoprotein with Yx(FWY)xxD motif
LVAKIATDATLGKILVDQAGKTVYLWFKDIDESSQCYDACAAVWPPFLTEVKNIAGDGVTNGKLGVLTRRDGKLQVTYNARPLYYFVRDSATTPTAGHGSTGFGALWVVVQQP